MWIYSSQGNLKLLFISYYKYKKKKKKKKKTLQYVTYLLFRNYFIYNMIYIK